MNKQEAIEKIKGKTEYFKVKKEYNRGFRDGLNSSIPVIREIDEPEKPVLSKEEAEWVDGLKEEQERRPFWTKYSTLYFITRCGFGYGFSYDHKGREIELKHYPHEIHAEKERLANAILYGYEVKKEKLYTAKLKSTGEYLHYKSNFTEIHHFRASDDDAKYYEEYHFTEDELRKYYAWENEAYDVNEVEE